MAFRFDFPWESAPNDGASASVGSSTPFDPIENEELFQAWCRERHQSIELRLCLDEAAQLLKRILAEDQVSPESRRRAKLLLMAIRSSHEENPGPSAT